jgi:hypothetical protein
MKYISNDIRLLYGSSIPGRHKKSFRILLSPQTYEWMASNVEIGSSKFGSAFIEMSIRTMLALITGGEEVNVIAGELKVAVTSPYLETNLLRLLRYLVDDKDKPIAKVSKVAPAEEEKDEEKLNVLGEAIFETMGLDNGTEWQDTVDDLAENTE